MLTLQEWLWKAYKKRTIAFRTAISWSCNCGQLPELVSDLQSTAYQSSKDLQKSLIHSCEADASREILNSNASALPVKKKTKFFSKTHCDAECLNMISNFFLAYNKIYFPCILLQTEQDMSWYLQNATN